MNDDLQHLQILSIFHFVVGGITGLCACFPLVHFVIGVLMVTGAFNAGAQGGAGAPPEAFGWFFIVFAALMISCGWTMAVMILIAGRCLIRRTHHMYCLVVAGIECCFMPLGTILGVFTLIVLLRPSVKTLFAQGVYAKPPLASAPEPHTQ